MARKQRIHYEGALYHVMVRGNNGEYILKEESEKKSYKDLIYRYKKKYDFKLYAYCIMDNHVHMLIQVAKTPLSKIMQGIQQVYTQRYNKKNKRTGHVFQQRYKAILCKKDGYLLYLTKYIHMNPRNAMLKGDIEYEWSSYKEYQKGIGELADIDFVLNMISPNKTIAIKEYTKFIDKEIENIEKAEYEILEEVTAEKQKRKQKDIEEIINEVVKEEQITIEKLMSKGRARSISKARQKIILKAERDCNITNTELAKRLNISLSAISKAINRD
ncbi:transposase [Clostridiaceae bacterium M8S5]|nr:transposase [Clostridiaceae bacterium M8S5]